MKKDEFYGKTYEIIGAGMEVFHTLGCGFTEYVYQDALEIEFQRRNIPYIREFEIPVYYKEQLLKHNYKCDFLCYGKILVEAKSYKTVLGEHKAQIINYIRATGLPLGYLMNFGESSFKHHRFFNEATLLKQKEENN